MELYLFQKTPRHQESGYGEPNLESVLHLTFLSLSLFFGRMGTSQVCATAV